MVTGREKAIEELKGFLPTKHLVCNPVIEIKNGNSVNNEELEVHYQTIRENACETAQRSHWEDLMINPWKKPINVRLLSHNPKIIKRSAKVWKKKLNLKINGANEITYQSLSVDHALFNLLSIALLTPNALRLMKLFPQIPKFGWWLQSKINEPKIEKLHEMSEFWMSTEEEDLNVEDFLMSF